MRGAREEGVCRVFWNLGLSLNGVLAYIGFFRRPYGSFAYMQFFGRFWSTFDGCKSPRDTCNPGDVMRMGIYNLI